jgi:hypothetical protein
MRETTTDKDVFKEEQKTMAKLGSVEATEMCERKWWHEHAW